MVETKENILLKAQTLFLRYGIKSVTMDDVARELNISKKTLYQFYENKADLLNSITELNEKKDRAAMTRILSESKDAIDEMFGIARYVTSEIMQIISPTALYDLQKYYPEIWAKFEEFNARFIYEHIKNNLERGIREGLYRENISADIIAKLYVGKTQCVVDEDMFPSRGYDKLTLFKQYFACVDDWIFRKNSNSPKTIRLFELFGKRRGIIIIPAVLPIFRWY
ncbi:MAG: TetR/AcrR family transcriptional regulator [Saprospiraceae bacterium]|nr:TetR/AcrR family transcriptional regulator [Saprospiraceae bacterium]